MVGEYDHITAFHYAAFRPPLHSEILKACVKEDNEYLLGLDVGCGTGQSATALSGYCKKVIGIDPSEEMLEKTVKHPRVEYQYYNCNYFDFPKDHFDIITFAGSLFYGKSQELLNEVVRVSKDAAEIIIYDFQVLLDSILEELLTDSANKEQSNYDHQVNFDGLKQENLEVKKVFKKSIQFEISIANIAHLLLSSKDNYSLLFARFGENKLYNKILQKLHLIYKSKNTLFKANTYATVYKIVK